VTCGVPGRFPDADLVNYVKVMYGLEMATRCAEIFKLDPENESGFAGSIRRSLTREIEALSEGG
jgi:hypothetical protein